MVYVGLCEYVECEMQLMRIRCVSGDIIIMHGVYYRISGIACIIDIDILTLLTSYVRNIDVVTLSFHHLVVTYFIISTALPLNLHRYY
jgi:hypothetical protein